MQDSDTIDFDEVMDEFGESSGDRDQSPLLNDERASKERQDITGGSIDLDNSDDLNRIISKYENMLGDEKGNPSSKLNGRASGKQQSPLGL